MARDIMFEEVLSILKLRFPKIEIGYKDESWFWKLLPKRWRKNFTTTLFHKIWFPSKKEESWKILAHEAVHVAREDEEGSFWFLNDFLSPQIGGVWWTLCSLISLIFLCVLTPFWWLGVGMVLCGLIFFLPWPSKKRLDIERDAYMMSLCVNYWRYGSIIPETRAWLIDIFYGWGYYKMIWNKEDATTSVDRIINEIIWGKGHVKTWDPTFTGIHEIVRKHFPKKEN